MPRPLMAALEPGFFHLTAHAVREVRVLFRDEDEHRLYLGLLARAMRDEEVRILAFCLMGNHVHVLVEGEPLALGRAMQVVQGDFARAFNAATAERSGHVWDARYRPTVIRSEGHLMHCFPYLAENPVRAGFCARPEDWRWSSHNDLRGATDEFRFLDRRRAYGVFGGDAAGYTRLVARQDAAAFADLDAGRAPLGEDLEAAIRAKDDEALRYAVEVLGRSAASLASVMGVDERTARRRVERVRKVPGTFRTGA